MDSFPDRQATAKGTYTQEGGGLRLQGYTMAIVHSGNPTPKKLPTGGGEWPTFHTARAQRTVRPHCPRAYAQRSRGWGEGPIREFSAPPPPYGPPACGVRRHGGTS